LNSLNNQGSKVYDNGHCIVYWYSLFSAILKKYLDHERHNLYKKKPRRIPDLSVFNEIYQEFTIISNLNKLQGQIGKTKTSTFLLFIIYKYQRNKKKVPKEKRNKKNRKTCDCPTFC